MSHKAYRRAQRWLENPDAFDDLDTVVEIVTDLMDAVTDLEEELKAIKEETLG
jgi:hypothetical protein